MVDNGYLDAERMKAMTGMALLESWLIIGSCCLHKMHGWRSFHVRKQQRKKFGYGWTGAWMMVEAFRRRRLEGSFACFILCKFSISCSPKRSNSPSPISNGANVLKLRYINSHAPQINTRSREQKRKKSPE